MSVLQWWQPSEGKEDMWEDEAEFEPGGGGPKGVDKFFKSVTQAVFLFVAETWVLNPVWSGP